MAVGLPASAVRLYSVPPSVELLLPVPASCATGQTGSTMAGHTHLLPLQVQLEGNVVMVPSQLYDGTS